MTVAWYASPDLVATKGRRAWLKVGTLAAGGAVMAWQERGNLRDAKQELATSHDIAQRLDSGELSPDDPEVTAFLDAGNSPAPGRMAVIGAVASSAVRLGSEVAFRRLSARRTARGARFPHLPGAVARGLLALAVGPLTRTLEKLDASPKRLDAPRRG